MRVNHGLIGTAVSLLLGVASLSAQAQSQGVSANEILVGSIQDLSGPLAGFSKMAAAGMQMRADEINAKGGIQGRKIKVIVEDSAYNPTKAVQVAQKLVNQDKVFVVAGSIGTVVNNAAMPVQFEKNVMNFAPLTAARDMFEPVNKLKFAILDDYYGSMKEHAPVLFKKVNAKKACILHQDDEFGLEVARGVTDGLKSINIPISETTTYKRGATDFSSQIVKLKAANCDFVGMGTLIRETPGAIGEARKTGFNPTFMGSIGAYTELVPMLGKEAVNGFYAVNSATIPYADSSNENVRAWAASYKSKYGMDPQLFSLYGYWIIELLSRGMEKAGANLTTESLVRALETMGPQTSNLGLPPVHFTDKNHLGSSFSVISQIQNGRWVEVK
jgi:branched-chain amino acid transport system substrate-binding protein